MGCAYVQKTDIKTNDIDLISGEITKPHRNEVNNDLSISSKRYQTKYSIQKNLILEIWKNQKIQKTIIRSRR